MSLGKERTHGDDSHDNDDDDDDDTVARVADRCLDAAAKDNF